MINGSLKIGIVGGGQLGKMLTIAAKKMGFFVTVIDPTPQSPAGQVADQQIIADFKNAKAIKKLAQISDILTFEIELANDKILNELEKDGKIINPSPKTLGIIRDKLVQKKFLQKNKIPTADFIALADYSSGDLKLVERQSRRSKDSSRQARTIIHDYIKQAANQFGFPFLLKARTDSYDGRGNYLIKNYQDIDKGLIKLKGRKLYIERYIPFVKELAVIIARNNKGKIVSYPVVETIHKANICDTVIAPAQISKKNFEKAKALAIKTMKHLKGAGVFAIEMFLEKDNNIVVNEIAPRVHNSGHFTIEGAFTSQFEQHIRAIAGLPLGSTKMLAKVAVMKNILGEMQGNPFPKGIEKALKIDGVSLHVYGKSESRPQRKMGHITVLGNSIEECLRKANRARKALVI